MTVCVKREEYFGIREEEIQLLAFFLSFFLLLLSKSNDSIVIHERWARISEWEAKSGHWWMRRIAASSSKELASLWRKPFFELSRFSAEFLGMGRELGLIWAELYLVGLGGRAVAQSPSSIHSLQSEMASKFTGWSFQPKI